MVEYIPGGSFRASFKFCIGDNLREKMEGGKKEWNVFQCTLICTNLYKLCSLKILKIVGPLSKMKPWSRRVPKIGKKTLESCMYKILIIKWKQLLVHIWRNTKTNGNNNLRIPIRIGSMVTHFQLPQYEYHWTSRQARDIAINANSLVIRFFSKEYSSCAANTELL
jgi:hypothetical protein